MGRGMCSVAARVLLLSSIPWVDGHSAAGPLLVRRDVVSAALAILNAVPGPGCDVAVIGASGRTGEECVRYCVATGRSERALSRKGSFLAVSSPFVRSAEPLKSPPLILYIFIYSYVYTLCQLQKICRQRVYTPLVPVYAPLVPTLVGTKGNECVHARPMI